MFFNGAVPGWNTALSASIPRRKIVTPLVTRFQHAETSGRPIVTLLLAAACEGKTTAMLQAAFEVVRDKAGWQILRRVDDAEPLEAANILPVLTKEHRWLVLLDEADRVAKEVFAFIPKLPVELQGRVHFLLACRDTDWRASGAAAMDWSSVCTFYTERLSGLGGEDATAIVTAWAAYGDQGLGDLAAIPQDQRAARLDEQAREEAKTAQGAFFGALLAVRLGNDLPNHVRLMLERLGHREIPSGGTLRDAIGMIAAMHSEGLEFLSRPVLARALSCPIGKLHRDVLSLLGQEAAATTTSWFVFTRHRRIASATMSVLEQDFNEDPSELFVLLARTAIETFLSGDVVPNLAGWRYALAQHLFDSDRQQLALRVAQAVLDAEPSNPMTIDKVSSLYRKAGEPERAVNLFRSAAASTTLGRANYHEWGVGEGALGDNASAALLEAYSISDGCAGSAVDNERAKQSLAGLGVAFGELFASYREVGFNDARAAVAVLGQTLHLDTVAASYFRKHLDESTAQGAKVPSVEEAFGVLRQGIFAATAIGVNDAVAALVPDAMTLGFHGLQQLIYASIAAHKRSQ